LCLHAGGSVNTNDLSIDPLTIIRSQEGDDTGNIERLANTIVWRPSGSILIDLIVAQLLTTGNVLLADGVIHISLNTTRGNAVDSNLLITAIDSHAASKGLDGTLGARIDSVLWNTLGLTSDGSHENDTTTNLEVLVSLTSDEELSPSVDGEDAVEFLLCDIFKMTERDDTRVGGDDVELAKVFLGFLEELNGLGDVGNVGLDGNSLASHTADLVAHLLGGSRAVGIVDNNIGTTAGELKSHFFSDTTA